MGMELPALQGLTARSDPHSRLWPELKVRVRAAWSSSIARVLLALSLWRWFPGTHSPSILFVSCILNQSFFSHTIIGHSPQAAVTIMLSFRMSKDFYTLQFLAYLLHFLEGTLNGSRAHIVTLCDEAFVSQQQNPLHYCTPLFGH